MSHLVRSSIATCLVDVATLQALGIFSGAGLLLSLLLAMSGWV